MLLSSGQHRHLGLKGVDEKTTIACYNFAIGALFQELALNRTTASYQLSDLCDRVIIFLENDHCFASTPSINRSLIKRCIAEIVNTYYGGVILVSGLEAESRILEI